MVDSLRHTPPWDHSSPEPYVGCGPLSTLRTLKASFDVGGLPFEKRKLFFYGIDSVRQILFLLEMLAYHGGPPCNKMKGSSALTLSYAKTRHGLKKESSHVTFNHNV